MAASWNRAATRSCCPRTDSTPSCTTASSAAGCSKRQPLRGLTVVLVVGCRGTLHFAQAGLDPAIGNQPHERHADEQRNGNPAIHEREWDRRHIEHD